MGHKIVFIGAGNLATHLASELHNKKYQISQVYSRTENSASALAEILNCPFTTDPTLIDSEADIYIIVLTDSAFHTVLPQVDFKNQLLIHCSGGTSLLELERYSQNIGVLYPLQTFSKSRAVKFEEIPVFIESNSQKNLDTIKLIADSVSDSVTILNSEKRNTLHVSAVLVNNFVNHFYALADGILNKEGIPFDVLKPLIIETARKINEMPPFDAQTGPAVRNDITTQNNHLKILEKNNDIQELYKLVSKSIFKHHH